MNDDVANLWVITLFFIFHGIICLWVIIKYQYDLNSLYRGRYLIFQDLILLIIHTECCFFMSLSKSDYVIQISSYVFIITHSAFFTTYFLFIYRIYILNQLEFGKFSTNLYKNVPLMLSPLKIFKYTVIFTLIISLPMLYLYSASTDRVSVIYMVEFNSSNKKNFAFALYFFIVSFIEYFVYLILFVFILCSKFRITVGIEVFLNLFVWTSYYSYRYLVSEKVSYSFLLPTRNFMLSIILNISLVIRSNLARVPDPPFYFFNSDLIYEHKQFYQHIYLFLMEKNAFLQLKLLELGIYIRIDREKKHIKNLMIIEKICEECNLKRYCEENFDYFEEIVACNNANVFEDFRGSTNFLVFKRYLENKSKFLLL